MLKRIFVTGGWRNLHNEKLHSLDSSSSILKAIRSMLMRCAGHVACMGGMRSAEANLGDERAILN